MGEKVYTIKLTFSSKEAAKAGKKKLTVFLKEVESAYWRWQDCRSGNVEPEAFWTMFKNNFPNAYDFLKSFKMADHPHFASELAGKMSLVAQEGDADGVKVRGNDVLYASEVWHMAEWGPFATYAKTKFGATEVELGGGAGS